MDQSAYVLVEVLPLGSTKIIEVFEAPSLAMAEEYATSKNETALDKHVQRFQVQGPFLLGWLMRHESGRLMAFA